MSVIISLGWVKDAWIVDVEVVFLATQEGKRRHGRRWLTNT